MRKCSHFNLTLNNRRLRRRRQGLLFEDDGPTGKRATRLAASSDLGRHAQACQKPCLTNHLTTTTLFTMSVTQLKLAGTLTVGVVVVHLKSVAAVAGVGERLLLALPSPQLSCPQASLPQVEAAAPSVKRNCCYCRANQTAYNVCKCSRSASVPAKLCLVARFDQRSESKLPKTPQSSDQVKQLPGHV